MCLLGFLISSVHRCADENKAKWKSILPFYCFQQILQFYLPFHANCQLLYWFSHSAFSIYYTSMDGFIFTCAFIEWKNHIFVDISIFKRRIYLHCSRSMMFADSLRCNRAFFAKESFLCWSTLRKPSNSNNFALYFHLTGFDVSSGTDSCMLKNSCSKVVYIELYHEMVYTWMQCMRMLVSYLFQHKIDRFATGKLNFCFPGAKQCKRNEQYDKCIEI